MMSSGVDLDPITVLVVDDDPLTRQAIGTILSSDPAIRVCAEAGDGEQAYVLAGQTRPDVVLMDIRMPGEDGLTALARLLRRTPGLPVIMLTTFADRDSVDRALTAGASGFLSKTTAPEELTRAIRAAHHGGLALSPTVARWVVQRWAPQARADDGARERLARLSPRQRDVLGEVAAGRSNAEIGRRLHLSEGTIKGYVSEIIAALGVRNRVEAAVLAHRAGEE